MIWTSTFFNLKSLKNFTKEVLGCHIMTYRFAIFRNMRLNKIFSVCFSGASDSATSVFASIGPANGLTK